MPRVAGRRSQAFFQKKVDFLRPVFSELKLDEAHLPSVAKRPNPELMASRLRTMAFVGVPMKGLAFKLSLSQAQFAALIKRYSQKHPLNSGQQALFDFLRKKKVPQRLATKLASSKTYHQMKIPEKIAYFESINLDPAKYGVSKIPVRLYAQLLAKPLEEIMRGINRQILWKLEDEHSEKLLDAKLPNWRSVQSLFPKTGGRIRPTKILQRVRDLILAGIEPSVDNICQSLSAAKKRASRRKSTPSFSTSILLGSPIAEELKSIGNKTALALGERRKAINQIEVRLSEINLRLRELSSMRVQFSSERVLAKEEARSLSNERAHLVDKRNGLLVGK